MEREENTAGRRKRAEVRRQVEEDLAAKGAESTDGH